MSCRFHDLRHTFLRIKADANFGSSYSCSRIRRCPRYACAESLQTLKFKRDELFRNFEVHPGKLRLAREIKDIDDQIAELNAGKKKARADSPK